MTQIKPPFLHLWSSVLSLCRPDDLSSWADFAKALLKFPAACCNCSCHTLFIPFFHTLCRPHPVSLSGLFTCPLMGRGLHLQCVFRCVYASLLICERAPLFCDQVLTDVCFPAFILKRVFPRWRLSFFLGYTLRLLIMDKVAEGNHNRYKCMRGGNFKGANFPLPRKRKERGRNAFNWEQRVR